MKVRNPQHNFKNSSEEEFPRLFMEGSRLLIHLIHVVEDLNISQARSSSLQVHAAVRSKFMN